MRKILLFFVVLSISGYSYAVSPFVASDGRGPYKDTNCNQAKYFSLTTLCQDTDDGKLYKGTGAAVEEIASPVINDSITDSNTTSAPSENAVFDALALKAPINNPTFTGGISVAATAAGGQYNFNYEDTDNGSNYSGDIAYGNITETWLRGRSKVAPLVGQVEMAIVGKTTRVASDGSNQDVVEMGPVYKDSAQEPVIDDPDNFAANFTGANLYGGTFIANAAGTAVFPEPTCRTTDDCMNFTYILEGANANIADPLGTGTADTFYMNGLAAAADENITSSTSGAMCVFQYRAANSWIATCNGWKEATPP